MFCNDKGKPVIYQKMTSLNPKCMEIREDVSFKTINISWKNTHFIFLKNVLKIKENSFNFWGWPKNLQRSFKLNESEKKSARNSFNFSKYQTKYNRGQNLQYVMVNKMIPYISIITYLSNASRLTYSIDIISRISVVKFLT